MKQLNGLITIASMYGVTVNEAASAAEEIAKMTKEAITDDEIIACIQRNSLLTRHQKQRLIKQIQK
uniref:Uncharacterized protein n=1 Tax=Dulem virus 37 TaxID=3145755 RepID=A0AAU8AY65_9CAUD